MRELRIRLFGGFEVHRGGSLLPQFGTQKSKSLFAYLVLSRGRCVHRDILCGRLWGDCSPVAAKKALRTALWRIRSVIEPDKRDRGTFLEVEGHQLRLRGSDHVWVDAWEFDECVGALERHSEGASDSMDLECLTKAASLYRGDLLEGMYVEWCEAEQVRFRLIYLTVLELLMAHHQRARRWREAILVGTQVLHRDPLREHVHRTVMECHIAIGDRPLALRQYRECARHLDEALGISPMAQTMRRYERIRAGDIPGRRAHEATPSGDSKLGDLASEVDGALRTLYSVTRRLERARVALGSDESVVRGSD